ncbi:MAG TPA: hypothetical protein VM935_15560 [Chitinophagaceae bacterium]|jgi:hypothetical protein|nr:hypothetical protein [Chitinophagaceae bacterium]
MHNTSAQKGYLFIKKNGRKVATYIEGQVIRIKTERSGVIQGYISLLKNDTVFMNGQRFHRKEINQVIVRDKKRFVIDGDAQTLALLTVGVGLATFGMTLNERESFPTALKTAAVIGYSPLLISAIRKKISFKRRSYIMGKKFRIDILDLYF